jgi:hypothetical protein
MLKPQWKEVRGDWGKWYNEEDYDLYFSPDIVCKLWVMHPHLCGFGGLVVSMLAFGTQDRGFTPGQSRWIFQVKNPSFRSHLPHVADLRHVKETYNLPWKSQVIG